MSSKRINEASCGRLGRRWGKVLVPTLFASLLGFAACDDGQASQLPDEKSVTPSQGSGGAKSGGVSGGEPGGSGVKSNLEALCGSNASGYSALPNGEGGYNYEQASYPCKVIFDESASLAAFKTTVYPLVRKNCAQCHNTETLADAPIIADVDANLAHAYALTRVSFRHPEESKLATHLVNAGHNCWAKDCAESNAQMVAAVKSWVAAVQQSLPPIPRSVAESVKVSEEDVQQWIAADREKVAAADREYMVYVSLHEMHNAGESAQHLNVARVGLSKALNSTARWAPTIVNPVDINEQGMVYRFDTRSYWGNNKGVSELIFGGSDEDIIYGSHKDLIGKSMNFSRTITKDPAFATKVWGRVQQGSKDAFKQRGKAANIKGFKSDYVELSQLVYTLSRPDVYNSIMSIPYYTTELEDELEVVKGNGAKSYQWAAVEKGITIAPRYMFRAATKSGGYYWKSFDMFATNGQKFPFWENPIPKFIAITKGSAAGCSAVQFAPKAPASDLSMIATLAAPSKLDPQPKNCKYTARFNQVIDSFALCTDYTGDETLMQQHASEIFYNLPNGLMGFAIGGGINQRRTDAFSFIVKEPRRLRGGSYDRDIRLLNGASCMSCHEDGMKRESNSMREKLDKGQLSVGADVAAQVRELYPTTSKLRAQIEADHKPFIEGMVQIRKGMMLGDDTNLGVEPIGWTFEWAQGHYSYADTIAN